jgi:hypothetical protein
MFNVKNEAVKQVQAKLQDGLCLSSNAIEAFARTLGYADSVGERDRLQQPTLVLLNWDNLEWWSSIREFCWATQRLVIAVEKGWLLDHLYDDHRSDRPMAVAFARNGDELGATKLVLHHSRSGRARLCSDDLAYEYASFVDGTAGWIKLTKAFAKRAATGVQRAGEWWFRDHNDLEIDDLFNVMRQMDEEDPVPFPVRLPGVVLNMGRGRGPSLSERAT